MKVAVLTLPPAEAKLVLGSPLAVLTLPPQTAALSLGAPVVPLVLPPQEAILVCDSPLDETFTTPTLTSWAALAEDNGSLGADVHFTASVTAGSPCRVRFMLRQTGSNDQRTGYSSPEQNSPHLCQVTGITAVADRGVTYDLYWGWTSGMESAAYALVASGVIYVPNNGEGDFPASG